MAEMIVSEIPADVVETDVIPDQIDIMQEQITADLPPAAQEEIPLKPPKQLSLF